MEKISNVQVSRKIYIDTSITFNVFNKYLIFIVWMFYLIEGLFLGRPFS